MEFSNDARNQIYNPHLRRAPAPVGGLGKQPPFHSAVSAPLLVANPLNLCTSPQESNPGSAESSLVGAVLIALRGNCTFTQKAAHAAAAGAAALLVVNTEPGCLWMTADPAKPLLGDASNALPPAPASATSTTSQLAALIHEGGGAGGSDGSATIPALGLTREQGAILLDALALGTHVHVVRQQTYTLAAMDPALLLLALLAVLTIVWGSVWSGREYAVALGAHARSESLGRPASHDSGTGMPPRSRA